MPIYAVRLFYLGTHYHGSQYQPGLDTVQGRLIEAVAQWEGLPHDTKTVRFSGRTDRGVHSLGQLVTIETNTPLNLNEVNRHLPQDIVLWAHTQVDDLFNPRHNALLRHYRYYLPAEDASLSLSLMKKAAQELVGTNNYIQLSKPNGDRTTYATLLDISISRKRNVVCFDVYGTNFLWKQVRKMVTLLSNIGNGQIEPELSRELVECTWKPPGGIRPAPEEGLVLIEVMVNFNIKPNRYALNRVRKCLNHRLGFFSRTLIALNGLTNDVQSYRYPFY